jgi:hypothetical protein
VEPLAAVAAVPKRKVGFDAEVPPAKAAADATPGLPFYSTAAAGSRRYVRRSRRTNKQGCARCAAGGGGAHRRRAELGSTIYALPGIVYDLYGLAQDACPSTSTSFPTTQVVDTDLMDMLVRELKDELESRSESKTGNKAWLRRRLHGAIVRDHLDAAA